MPELSRLPNVGKVLEGYLLQVGIETPEQLRKAGAEEAFTRICLQVDASACLHMVLKVRLMGYLTNYLPDETKQELRAFYIKIKGAENC